MIIGDSKHIERLTSFGFDLTDEETLKNLDTSFTALATILTKEALQLEVVTKGETNA